MIFHPRTDLVTSMIDHYCNASAVMCAVSPRPHLGPKLPDDHNDHGQFFSCLHLAPRAAAASAGTTAAVGSIKLQPAGSAVLLCSGSGLTNVCG